MGLLLAADTSNIGEAFMIKGVAKLPFKFLGSEVWITTTAISTAIITLLLIVFAIFIGKNFEKAKEIPIGVQNVFEMAIEALNSMFKSILGDNSYRFANYIGTIFIFILVCNLSGLLGLRAPTADFGVTFCLGLFTFAIVQFQGIKNRGPVGHFGSLFQPTPVLFPINLIGELANPMSISLRLFANLLAGTIIMGLWYSVLLPIFMKFAIPAALHAYLDVFSGCIQTYVFCMLSMVYINDKL